MRLCLRRSLWMQPGTLAVSQWLDFGSKNAQVNGNVSFCIRKELSPVVPSEEGKTAIPSRGFLFAGLAYELPGKLCLL